MAWNGVTTQGNVIIPANNIAWVSKLRDPLNLIFIMKFQYY